MEDGGGGTAESQSDVFVASELILMSQHSHST